MCSRVSEIGKLEMGTFEAKRKGIYLTLPSCPRAGTVIDLLTEILQGMIPTGYRPKDGETKNLDLPSPLKSSLLAILEGVSECIRVYCIENEGGNLEIIHTDALKGEGASWVFLSAYELDWTEQALCIIGVNK